MMICFKITNTNIVIKSITAAGRLAATITSARQFRFLLLLIIIAAVEGACQTKNTKGIRLNQLGFYPKGPKIAIVQGDSGTEFFVADTTGKREFFRGKLEKGIKSYYSDKVYRAADFSSFKQAGQFVIVVPGVGKSHAFEIRDDVHQELAVASIRNYYFQRMSMPLDEKYAGKWARPAGHPDREVLVHPSAASTARPAGTVISAPRGWYDAGDYNKYIVNSGITMGTMLSAFEDFPEYYAQLSLNIPESSNDIPDLLDEILWNLRWMLTMQDSEDGGVYHKLTNPAFDGMVMPNDARGKRYVVQKGTAASLDFAAVTAQAARVFAPFEAQLPGLADTCLAAAKRAWQWASQNPDKAYNQQELNRNFDPDIVTGEYGDRNFKDEFIWAGCELFITTGERSFLPEKEIMNDQKSELPSWGQVKLLGYHSLLRHGRKSGVESDQLADVVRKRVVALADKLIENTSAHGLRTVMGKSRGDYIWGSSAVAANQGIALLQAYRLTGQQTYLDHSLGNLDYLLGRNATGYSFVTGFGSKTPMHPHHRPSEADGVVDPIPGMLCGGPNAAMQDKCTYPSTIAEEAFVDAVCSYASNEIAINWNAPLVYLAGAIEVLSKDAGY